MFKSYSIVIMIILTSFLWEEGIAQSGAVGHWEGSIQVVGTDLGIKTDFKKSGDTLIGTIDIPPQNVYGLPLKNMRLNGDQIHFELPAGPGVAVFDGIVSGDSSKGDFMQSGMKGGFYLRKSCSGSRSSC